MTDQELLEYAAKAVGVTLTPMSVKPLPPRTDDGFIGYMSKAEEWPSGWFNPLTSDADAFRLAVKLTLSVFPPDDGDPTAVVEDWEWDIHITEVDEDGDYLATTRRAIVRAAAEIGRYITND